MMHAPIEACHPTTKMLAVLLFLLREASGQACTFHSKLTLETEAKIITSPWYPGLYYPSTTCYYYFYTDVDQKISINCHEVEMGDVPWSCSDNLKLVGSMGGNDVSFCSPFNMQSSENRLIMIFSSTNRSSGGKFSCSVKAIRREQCDCGWTSSKRIVGGKNAGVNEFPFMVSIVNALIRQHACGASVISPFFVITAAHCLVILKPNYTGILVGEHDMSTGAETTATRLHRAEQFFIHPAYNSSTSWNDIGLIKSATAIQFNSKVGPICLPFNRPTLPQVGDTVTTMGWGTTSFGGPTSDILQKVALHVVPDRRCQAAFNTSAASGKQVCTFRPGKDSCQMDSGGPLIVHGTTVARVFLAGIISFGGACGGDDPAVNTKVTPYLGWIQDVTKANFCIK